MNRNADEFPSAFFVRVDRFIAPRTRVQGKRLIWNASMRDVSAVSKKLDGTTIWVQIAKIRRAIQVLPTNDH